MPHEVIDGRILGNRPAGTYSATVASNLPIILPELSPEVTTFDRDEIVVEVDVHCENRYDRIHIDPFTGIRSKHVEVVVSGNGGIVWRGDTVRSRLYPEREQYLSRDVLEKFRYDGLYVPGQAIAISIEKKTCRIVDMMNTEDGRQMWEKLRRVAFALEGRQQFFLAAPLAEISLLVKNQSDLLGYLWSLRELVDSGCGTKGARRCRPVQRVDFLPTREALAKTGKARIFFNDQRLRQLVARDMKLRADQFGNPTLYGFSDCWTPALAGCAGDQDVDFDTSVFDPAPIAVPHAMGLENM